MCFLNLMCWKLAWTGQIMGKLNLIHADNKHIHRQLENIMAEIQDLKDAMANLKTEVGEAIAKFSETLAKLADAVAASGDAASLKEAIAEATGELEVTAKALDDAFGTEAFTPSGS